MGFSDIVEPDGPKQEGQLTSDVHALWLTHVERFAITDDIGGWMPASFHKNLAKEIIKGWRGFQKQAPEDLPANHPVVVRLQSGPHALNDAFFIWQKEYFQDEGQLPEDGEEWKGSTSWPELDELPEYRKLRRIVEKAARRYLEVSGMRRASAQNLSMSIFNWAAVHGSGEFHPAHTHVGEFLAGVFYAQVGDGAGKIQFADPRGSVAPFGHKMVHTPKAGELILFPSWLSHMVTVSHPAESVKQGDQPLRVVVSFNIGPKEGPLPCANFFSDPTAEMHVQRTSPIDLEEWGL